MSADVLDEYEYEGDEPEHTSLAPWRIFAPSVIGTRPKTFLAPVSGAHNKLSDNTNTVAKDKKTILSEIASLQSQCDKLGLELAKRRLEKRQSELPKSLAVELQPTQPSMITSATSSGTTLQKAKLNTDLFFLTSLDSIKIIIRF